MNDMSKAAPMTHADIIMLTMPAVPHRFGIFLTIAALIAAVKFTDWYPQSIAGKEAGSKP